MDTIWGSTAQYTQIAWGWEIAVYLFLAGLSAGALIISVLVKWADNDSRPDWDGLVKAGALLAPLTIMIGLGLLIIDLGKPLAFYLLMLHYQLNSVMSIGVILLSVYTPVALLYAATVYKEDLVEWPLTSSLTKALEPLLEKLEGRTFEMLNMALAAGIGCYTGFLLSALFAKPLFNVAVLPMLFLVSGLSAGAAATILTGVLFFRSQLSGQKVHYVHSLDSKFLGFELFVLFLMFTGLYYQGGVHAQVAQAALSTGIWAKVFWFGVVGAGLIVPLALNLLNSGGSVTQDPAAAEIAASTESGYGMVFVNSVLVLSGGLLLRFYVLYAGQIFIGS